MKVYLVTCCSEVLLRGNYVHFWNKSSCCCSDNPAFSLVCKLPVLLKISRVTTDHQPINHFSNQNQFPATLKKYFQHPFFSFLPGSPLPHPPLVIPVQYIDSSYMQYLVRGSRIILTQLNSASLHQQLTKVNL